MTFHNRKIKVIELDVGGTTFECQISNFEVQNNTPDGTKIYTMCPDGEDIEEVDADYALSLTFFADWRLNGISDFLQSQDGEDAAFVLDHHPDIVGEHVRWSGTLRIKAPNVGGDVKATETQTVVLQIIGKPTYARV